MPAASERACREAAGPRPAAVRYNDWRRIGLPEAGTFAPTLPVSVVVPCFEAPDALALTLAGLEGQDYPRELFEVVIVDDGSEPPLRRPAPAPLDVKVVRQERRGFGLARARNAGARAAAHGILVFLDGDVIAEAGLLAAHARWHHAVSDATPAGEIEMRHRGAVQIADLALCEIVERRARVVPGDERQDEIEILAAHPLARERGDFVHQLDLLCIRLNRHWRSPPVSSGCRHLESPPSASYLSTAIQGAVASQYRRAPAIPWGSVTRSARFRATASEPPGRRDRDRQDASPAPARGEPGGPDAMAPCDGFRVRLGVRMISQSARGRL